MNTISIQDGVSLHVINTDKFKTVSIAMLLRRPLNKDEVTINALIPNILKRGSEKYKSMNDIYKHTEYLYGAVFDAVVLKKGEEQIIQLFIEVVNKDNLLYEAIDFLHEIAINNLVIDGEFEQSLIAEEKENLRTVIEGRLNDKKDYAKLRCVEEMFREEPFGLYGDGYLEQIDGLKNIYGHYRNILKTSTIEFIFIGNVNAQDIKQKLKNDFYIERGQPENIPMAGFYFEKRGKKNVFEQSDILQAKLCVGLRTGINPVGDDFYKLMVANEILGGGANSKLFVNIREKESLCYYINSFIYRFKTAILIQSGMDEKDYEKALSLIQNEISKVKEGDITDDEFEKAILSLKKRILGIVDYPSGTMDFYLTQYMLNDGDGIEETIGKIEAVKKDGVKTAFKDIWVDTVYFLKGGC